MIFYVAFNLSFTLHSLKTSDSQEASKMCSMSKSLRFSITKTDISMDNIMDPRLYLEGLVLGLQDQASSHA
jgi:hypothetical protein